ncbi:hypothetical protein S7711_11315, partial [Stachybotrys chartarum IBT 7711]
MPEIRHGRSGSLNIHPTAMAAPAPRFDGPRSPPSAFTLPPPPPPLVRPPLSASAGGCPRMRKIADRSASSQTRPTYRASSFVKVPARPALPVPLATTSAPRRRQSANTLP